MLRRLYDWCIDAAGKPHAAWLMGAVSFAESSVFPIPPDTMLIPMSLARPDKAWYFATLCTVTSVAGGLLGYFIGAVLYDSIGQWLIHIYGLGGKVDAFREAYNHYGVWIILIKVVAVFAMLLVLTLFTIMYERKVVARMAVRPGPNQVGPKGWLQSLMDGMKLPFKEEIIPITAERTASVQIDRCGVRFLPWSMPKCSGTSSSLPMA